MRECMQCARACNTPSSALATPDQHVAHEGATGSAAGPSRSPCGASKRRHRRRPRRRRRQAAPERVGAARRARSRLPPGRGEHRGWWRGSTRREGAAPAEAHPPGRRQRALRTYCPQALRGFVGRHGRCGPAAGRLRAGCGLAAGRRVARGNAALARLQGRAASHLCARVRRP